MLSPRSQYPPAAVPITADTTGTGVGGVVSWSYAIDNAAAQQLANGQVVTEVHRITVNDQHGDTTTQDVTVTITGSNDEVLVSGVVTSGAVVEDGTASASGTASFTDVDLTDVHLVSSAAVSSDYGPAMGSFTAVKTADTQTAIGTVPGYRQTVRRMRRKRRCTGHALIHFQRCGAGTDRFHLRRRPKERASPPIEAPSPANFTHNMTKSARMASLRVRCASRTCAANTSGSMS